MLSFLKNMYMRTLTLTVVFSTVVIVLCRRNHLMNAYDTFLRISSEKLIRQPEIRTDTENRAFWQGMKHMPICALLFPSICSQTPEYLLQHLLAEVKQDTSFPQYEPFLVRETSSHMVRPVPSTLTQGLKNFCQGLAPTTSIRE